MNNLYFITGNKNKFQEVKQLLPYIKQLNLNLAEIQELNPQKIIKQKLLSAFDYQKANFIVEDTSLYFDCWDNKLPGPMIKWFMKTLGGNGLYNLVAKYNNFHATAKTIIGYAKNKQKIYYFEGILHGIITKPIGKNGFGWDQIFIPLSSDKTLAQISLNEKNQISMRKQAVSKLKKFLQFK